MKKGGKIDDELYQRVQLKFAQYLTDEKFLEHMPYKALAKEYYNNMLSEFVLSKKEASCINSEGEHIFDFVFKNYGYRASVPILLKVNNFYFMSQERKDILLLDFIFNPQVVLKLLRNGANGQVLIDAEKASRKYLLNNVPKCFFETLALNQYNYEYSVEDIKGIFKYEPVIYSNRYQEFLNFSNLDKFVMEIGLYIKDEEINALFLQYIQANLCKMELNKIESEVIGVDVFNKNGLDKEYSKNLKIIRNKNQTGRNQTKKNKML